VSVGVGVAGSIFEVIDLSVDVGTVDDRARCHVDRGSGEDLPDEDHEENRDEHLAHPSYDALHIVFDFGRTQEKPRPEEHQHETTEREHHAGLHPPQEVSDTHEATTSFCSSLPFGSGLVERYELLNTKKSTYTETKYILFFADCQCPAMIFET